MRAAEGLLERRWADAIADLPIRQNGWCYSRTPDAWDAMQGWKLHLSATILSASDVFAAARPVLRAAKVLWKVPQRLEQLRQLNKGDDGFSQIGKFLTIYPRSTAEAVRLARALHLATRRLFGPAVPFDRRYRRGSLVFYRYGALRRSRGFPAGFIRNPGGELVPDARSPGKAVPPWLNDPFRPANQQQDELAWKAALVGRSYFVLKALSQRGKGGVYEAFDLSVKPPRAVIIKEGRRHGETDWTGTDGFARIRHEGRVLRALRKAGAPVPEVLDEYTRHGTRYLVLEKIAGSSLRTGRGSWRRGRRILSRLQPMLDAIHSAGWVWRDCKPEHVLVTQNGWRLIDFEDACRTTTTNVLAWGTPPYAPQQLASSSLRARGTFEDDYALGVLTFLCVTGKYPPMRWEGRARLYRRASCPAALQDRIEALMDPASHSADVRPTRRRNSRA